ncbi:MAG TPA: SRPBCC family protein [Thermoanaerobaculia bacterium]|nr:SRPBCC family protein [Thermoanaerobaculia bacterium]
MKTVGKLQITTPSDREIAMTRAFDAPRHLVYDAWTKPELVKRWLGVRGGWTMPVCEIDLKVGGRYRYVWRGPTGNEMGMGGVFREVAPSERLVATEKFDDPWYEGEAVDTTTFVEKDGATTVTTTVLYSSKEARDGVLQSPMEKGVAESYDVLDEVLASSEMRREPRPA